MNYEPILYFLMAIAGIAILFAWVLKCSAVNRLNTAVMTRVEHKILDIHAHTWLWIVGFLSLTFMRDFLENFIETPNIVLPLSMRYEFTVVWIVIFLALSIFMHFISRVSLVDVSKLVVFVFLITFIAPICDAIFYYGSDFQLGYVREHFLENYFTFFAWSPRGEAATIGIRIEIFLALWISALYTAAKTQSWLRATFAALGSYSILFVWMATPMLHGPLVTLVSHIPGFSGVADELAKLRYPAHVNLISTILFVVLSSIYIYMLGIRKVTKALKIDTSDIKLRMRDVGVIIKNIRPLRVIHFMVLVLLGYALGYSMLWGNAIQSVKMDVLQIGILCAAIVFAWAFAVGINDIYDREIDAISNGDRPLIKGVINTQTYHFYALIFATISVLLALQVNNVSASIIFYFCVYYSYVYSAPPFRFRQYLFIPNIQIGVCCLLAVLLGMSAYFHAATFKFVPNGAALYIFLAFACASTLKDLKDYEGDKAAGICTLTTLLGPSRSRFFVAAMIATMFAAAPLFFQIHQLWIYSTLFAVLAFIATLQSKEKYIFIVWFIFAAILLVKFIHGSHDPQANLYMRYITLIQTPPDFIGNS